MKGFDVGFDVCFVEYVFVIVGSFDVFVIWLKYGCFVMSWVCCGRECKGWVMLQAVCLSCDACSFR